MTDKDQGKDELFGEGMPGTGGDFIDPSDVEGHRGRGARLPGADAGPDEARGGPGGHIPNADGSDDVEGHLYTGGPSTQGEFAKRAPTDNPHGER